MTKKRIGAVLRFGSLIGFGVVIAFLLFELGARTLFSASLPIYTSSDDSGRIMRRNISVVRHNDESGLDVRIDTNAWGLRDGDWDVSGRGPRILVIGDSYVEAAQVQKEDRFTELVQRQLRELGIDATVGNCGVSGAGPAIYLQLLTYCAEKFEPDINVVAFYSSNDFADSSALWNPGSISNYTIVDGSVVRYSTVAPRVQRLKWAIRGTLKKSATLVMLHEAYKRITASPTQTNVSSEQCPTYTDPNNRKMVDALRITEYLISEISAASSQPLIVMDIPNSSAVENEMVCNWLFPEQWLASLGSMHQYEFVPVLRSLRDEPEKTHWGHLNHKGHEVLGSLLTEKITQILTR